MRLQIQKNLLQLLLDGTNAYFDEQPYLAILYKTLFCVAYYGLFRMGELASGDHPVKVKDVHIADNKPKWMFILRSSKTHGLYAKPQTIKINKVKHIAWGSGIYTNGYTTIKSPSCPYDLLTTYLRYRPQYIDISEPFFVFSDYSPVTTVQVRTTLRAVLNSRNLDGSLYGNDSFGFGRSIDMFDLGISVLAIRKLGWWKLSVIYTYLKN